jgi:threonyl-tRNA synthetase
VIPVAHAFDDYASEVAKRLHDVGFFAEAHLSSDTLKKKILEAQFAQWNYILGMSHKLQSNGSRWTSGTRRSICECTNPR